MGQRCTWCESVLQGGALGQSPVNDVLCGGCLQELQIALASHRLRTMQVRLGSQEGPP